MPQVNGEMAMSDLIRRYDAIVALAQSADYISDALEKLEKVPAVDAVPVVHGQWIKMTGMMPPEYHGHYCCSECRWHMKGLRNSWSREEELSYCPNCGAKMDRR